VKYTNKYNIPNEIIRSLMNDSYSSGGADLSATGLLQPPQIRILNRENSLQITTDVSDRIWILLGQSVHNILERANEGNTDNLTEQRMFADIDGYKISGQTDTIAIEDKIVKDYKVTSTWSVLSALKNGKPDWEAQLNIYAYLYRLNYKQDISALNIIAIMRDWNKSGLLRNKDYPKCSVAVIPIPLWTEEEQLKFISDRISTHKQADMMFDLDGTTPECTDEERWAKPDTYAVMKKGRKSALRLLPTEEKAKDFMESYKVSYTDMSIQFRKGTSTRCEGYCEVAQFCNQYKESGGE
tara:strand:+ start:517 stop:1407 length:891 start_codon:yes stop_codon:yes gene_type:complete